MVIARPGGLWDAGAVPDHPVARRLPRDAYGLSLSTSTEAADAYTGGVNRLLRIQAGAQERFETAVAVDPGFALGHAALALLGHEYGADVDVRAATARARRAAAARASDRERSHVASVAAHVQGDRCALVDHLAAWPRDALVLSVAVPTIGSAGVHSVPEEAWRLVESLRPHYGADWWYGGLLAFVRQDQGRWDDAMALADRSLDAEPGAGPAVHAKTHAFYETGAHAAGLRWLDEWIATCGRTAAYRTHFSWHAALHELALGDFAALNERYTAQLAPPAVHGCRALVDSASLLWRWSLTPAAGPVPAVEDVLAAVDDDLLATPSSPFVAMHTAVALAAASDLAGLERLARWATTHPDPALRDLVGPLAAALADLVAGRPSPAADRLATVQEQARRFGGSAAQREVLEDTRIVALLRAGRCEEAREILSRRLDRRPSRRDEMLCPSG